MFKQLLAELTENDGYFIKNDTGENIGSTLKLYCYKSDDNNIYFDKPVIDYPENYTFIKTTGETIQVKDILQKNGLYKKNYAIISKHSKITSIEKFNIKECNNFYSIEINKELAHILEIIGLNNLIVDENLFGFYLLNFVEKSDGFELLFFIHSNEKEKNNILNEYRLNIIKQKIDQYCLYYCENGINVFDDKSLFHFNFNLQERLKLYSNTNKHHIYNLLVENNKFIKKYSEILYKRIEKLLLEGYKEKNFLYFGYTDEWIIEELKKDDIL